MSLAEWLRCPVCESPNVGIHDMARPAEGYTWIEVSCADCPESHSVHVQWAEHSPRQQGTVRDENQQRASE